MINQTGHALCDENSKVYKVGFGKFYQFALQHSFKGVEKKALLFYNRNVKPCKE
jgi:hypothetical protein